MRCSAPLNKSFAKYEPWKIHMAQNILESPYSYSTHRRSEDVLFLMLLRILEDQPTPHTWIPRLSHWLRCWGWCGWASSGQAPPSLAWWTPLYLGSRSGCIYEKCYFLKVKNIFGFYLVTCRIQHCLYTTLNCTYFPHQVYNCILNQPASKSKHRDQVKYSEKM